MNCHATRAVLDLHAEGRLTSRREQAVANHLASCAGCRALTALAPAAALPPSSDFKARLAAAMKAEKKSPTVREEPALNLWPRDLSGVALAALALAFLAAGIGWSGLPSQKGLSDEEFAAGRIP
ncbi:MAG: hypothetical protein Q8T11_01840 [Elusimicrobiota bacterium]|nr:hypothetical protein [Elusimicrobiota bacterium]